MRVEIWSDVICPWCGLGQHRLDKALADFAHRAEVEVVHRSFQLDPAYAGPPRPVRQMLREKYGMDEARLKATSAHIEGLAAQDGLAPYRVGDNVVGNTRLAHELLALASERGLEDAAWKRLYRAYFGEGRSIFDLDALVALAADVGLDPEEAREALTDGRYRDRVETDGRVARSMGATGVPFVVIDRRYAISGAQATEVFRRALDEAWGERASVEVAGGDDASCGPEGCDAPGD